MKEKIYEQIDNELRRASRTDIIITVIAIVLTLILFGVSYAFASSAVDYRYDSAFSAGIRELSVWATATFFISLVALIVIDLFSILALRNNIKRKNILAEKIATLYQEEGATAFSPEDITAGNRARGNLFIVIISALAGLGVIVPLIVFINNIVKEL
jgi:hypothetical protein